MSGDAPEQWAQHLHKAVFAMNACKQASTRYSPFFLAHALEPRLPLPLPDAVNENPPWHQVDAAAESEAQLVTRVAAVERAHTAAVDNLQAAQRRQVRQADARNVAGSGAGGAGGSAAVPRAPPAVLSKEEEPLAPGLMVFVAGRGQERKGPYQVVEHVVEQQKVLLEGYDKQRWLEPLSKLRVEAPKTPARKRHHQ